jgi:hypothetical protein
MFPHVLRVSNGDGGNDWHFHISATAEKVAQREAPQFGKDVSACNIKRSFGILVGMQCRIHGVIDAIDTS